MTAAIGCSTGATVSTTGSSAATNGCIAGASTFATVAASGVIAPTIGLIACVKSLTADWSSGVSCPESSGWGIPPDADEESVDPPDAADPAEAGGLESAGTADEEELPAEPEAGSGGGSEVAGGGSLVTAGAVVVFPPAGSADCDEPELAAGSVEPDEEESVDGSGLPATAETVASGVATSARAELSAAICSRHQVRTVAQVRTPASDTTREERLMGVRPPVARNAAESNSLLTSLLELVTKKSAAPLSNQESRRNISCNLRPFYQMARTISDLFSRAAGTDSAITVPNAMPAKTSDG